jgi:hypothetical protein
VSNHELIAWVNKQADAFESDMAETEDLDYAYANGAYMAYTLMLKQLVGTKYEVIKEKLWVADDGSWGSGDILIADVGTWTDEYIHARLGPCHKKHRNNQNSKQMCQVKYAS